jgi:hypothetical protein
MKNPSRNKRGFILYNMEEYEFKQVCATQIKLYLLQVILGIYEEKKWNCSGEEISAFL